MRASRSGGAVVLLAFLAGCRGVGPRSFYFPKLEIGPGFELRPQGPRTMQAPQPGEYYSFFWGAYIASVDHLQSKGDGGEPERLLYLETNLRGALDRTVKTEKVLQGAFGTVYAMRTCFYNRDMQVNVDSVGVGLGISGGEEAPEQLPGAPDGLPALTSVSLVRVFRPEQDDHRVAVGNYEANGALGAVHVGEIRKGQWVVPTDGGNMLQIGKPNPAAAHYGMPERIDLAAYHRRGGMVLPAVAMAEEETVLYEQFGWDAVIREDTLSGGRVSATRWLRSSVTEEQRVLDPPCEAQLRRQQEAGQRTVD